MSAGWQAEAGRFGFGGQNLEGDPGLLHVRHDSENVLAMFRAVREYEGQPLP